MPFLSHLPSGPTVHFRRSATAAKRCALLPSDGRDQIDLHPLGIIDGGGGWLRCPSRVVEAVGVLVGQAGLLAVLAPDEVVVDARPLARESVDGPRRTVAEEGSPVG